LLGGALLFTLIISAHPRFGPGVIAWFGCFWVVREGRGNEAGKKEKARGQLSDLQETFFIFISL
jgi:hypothetical protein